MSPRRNSRRSRHWRLAHGATSAWLLLGAKAAAVLR